MDDIDELYNDVGDVSANRLTREELHTRVGQLELELGVAKARNTKSEKSIKTLETQNQILKKNISVLFKTAQVELDRKNEEIQRLRKRLDWLQKANREASTSAPHPSCDNPALNVSSQS